MDARRHFAKVTPTNDAGDDLHVHELATEIEGKSSLAMTRQPRACAPSMGHETGVSHAREDNYGAWGAAPTSDECRRLESAVCITPAMLAPPLKRALKKKSLNDVEKKRDEFDATPIKKTPSASARGFSMSTVNKLIAEFSGMMTKHPGKTSPVQQHLSRLTPGDSTG